MQKVTILNSRQIRDLNAHLITQFGYALSSEYAYLLTDKNKIFLVNKDVVKLELKNLIIDRLGLYFGMWNETEVRLSKEGTQLLVLNAQKEKKPILNLIELTEEETKKYFSGTDLSKDLGEKAKLVILTYKKEVLGCAKYKEKKIINFLPKANRGEVIL